MAHALLQPEVLDFLHLATARNEFQMQIEQVLVRPGSPLARNDSRVTEMRDRYRVSVVAMRKADKAGFEMPGSDALIEAGDTLIVVGRSEDCASLTGQAH